MKISVVRFFKYCIIIDLIALIFSRQGRVFWSATTENL